jgi:transposase
VKLKRWLWQKAQVSMNLEKLVFIDESGAKTNMTRLYGRAKAGQRVVDNVPAGHWCTTTMILSVRLDGSTACMVVDGATNKDVFQAYVEHILLPTLKPGDIVILDNLSAHKNQETRDLIESVGAQVWFLPPYSPDLNPIEKMWSKIKSILRKLKARTEKELINAIAKALEAVTASDVRGWFESCGYQYTKT